MNKIIRYRLEGVDCVGCATKIETALCRVGGVADAAVSVAASVLTLTVEPESGVEEKVEPLLTRLGYGATVLVPERVAGGSSLVQGTGAGGAGNLVVDGHTATASAGEHDHEHGNANADTHQHTDNHQHTDKHGDSDGGGGDNHEGHDHSHGYEAGAPWWRQRSARLVFASAAAMAVAWVIGMVYEPLDRWVFALAMLVGLIPIARRAFAAAAAGIPFSIEMLMTVAAVGAVVIGSAEEAAIVVLLFLVGELLEGVTAQRARASIGKLADLVPKFAFIQRKDGSFEQVDAARLTVGDVIRVRPGDRIAADGEVEQGVGSVNEAPVTGESVPREKVPGDAVFAGTVNGESALLVKVTAAAADNTIARVIRLVEEAQLAKAPMARFIDRFARRYTPAIALLALLTACVPPLFGAAWGEWIYKALALLLIGCPCALVISTPTAVAAGLARGARYGLLLKGGAVLENAGRLGVIAFDKTGTLTEGTPKVTDVVTAGSVSEAEVLAIAAALEAGSSHPLALAVLERFAVTGAPALLADDLGAVAGRGVAGSVNGSRYFLGSARAAAERAPLDAQSAAAIDRLGQEGKTIAVLVCEGTAQIPEATVLGLIAMRDELRADAAAGIASLRARGIRCVMLTGDTERTAKAIAGGLGMEVSAELLPEDKQRIVSHLKVEANARGELAGVVGDGINDAPALAAADVGIAMGGGTDVALETADAAILRSNVSDVASMLNLSRATMRNIYQNIAFAIGFKGIFLVTTLLGITGLWPAILADTGATVLVTLNAMRLLRWNAPAAPAEPQ